MLADVGVTWYTGLEQGREVNPSEAVLVRVANALQCSPLETRHLFVLAGLTPPEATQVTVCEGISPGTRRMLDSLMPQPASIQKPNFDIVAWNDSFCRLMGIDFATLPEEDRNCIYLYLTHETWRSRIENRDVLPTFVSYFRAAMAEHRGDPAWENKLARFFAASSEFEALWHQRYEVRGVENQIKHFNHPQLGRFQPAADVLVFGAAQRLAPAGLPADGRGGRAGAGVAGPTLITGNQMAGNVPSSGIARPALLDGSLSLRE